MKSNTPFYKQPYKVLTSQEILKYAKDFKYEKPDPTYIKADYLTKDQFLNIADWKTSRQRNNYKINDPEKIKESTAVAFSSNISDEMRIHSLTILVGVNYPVASAILHFGYNGIYPIIDFRALWTLWGVKNDQYINYTPELWKAYVKACKDVSKNNNVSIRTLDKALWQYSKEHQK